MIETCRHYNVFNWNVKDHTYLNIAIVAVEGNALYVRNTITYRIGYLTEYGIQITHL